MPTSLLWRGLLVGALGGILAFAFAHQFGEPQVDRAVAFEVARQEALGVAPEPKIVSREVQSSFGSVTGIGIYGLALGGLFSLVFAAAQGRIARVRPRITCGLLALVGFFAIVVVPMTKYPWSPPGFGDPDTVGRRTQLYAAMILISLLGVVAAYRIGRTLMARWDPWNAVLAAAAVYLVIIVGAEILLPSVHQTPEGFPADVLWGFRAAAFGIQAVLWATIGLVFGALADRLLAEHPRPQPAAAADDATR